MVDVVAARARLLWHVQGELLADLARAVEATLAAESLGPDSGRPDSGRSDEVRDRVVAAVGDLVGWTVHWTGRYAQGQVGVADALGRRLPMVLAAVQGGLIDQAKAEAFVDALGCVDDETAVRIATRLLPKARTWTLTELRASLRYHVDKADPTAARRRYRRKVAEREVWFQADRDGTATLHAQGLAPHRAAAAYDRIDRIARAARACGDVRTLPQLRADALCDVLAGVPFQLSPSTDPLTAQADASTPGRPARPWYVPDWRTEPRFPNGTTASSGSGGHGDSGHSSHLTVRSGAGGGGGEPGGSGGGEPGGGGRGGYRSPAGHDGGGLGGPPPGSGGPRGGGDPGGSRRRGGDPGGGGSGGGDFGGEGPHATGGPSPDSGRPSGSVPVPPEEEPVGIIDLYDYDRACITDEDRAWADIGFEPPGAADDETPDWWHACHPTRPTPTSSHHSTTVDQPTTPARQQPTPTGQQPSAADGRPTPTAGAESRFQNRNPGPDPERAITHVDALHGQAARTMPIGAQPAAAGEHPRTAAETESRFQNRNPGSDSDHPVPAPTQPDAAEHLTDRATPTTEQPDTTSEHPTPTAGAESRSANRNPGFEPEHPVPAAAQANAQRDHVERSTLVPKQLGTAGERPTQAAGPESRFENSNFDPDLERTAAFHGPRATSTEELPSGAGECPSLRVEAVCCSQNGNPDPDLERTAALHEQAAQSTPAEQQPNATGERPMPAAGVESRFQNGIVGSDPEDRVWAQAQADALHDRAVLSWDVLPGDRCSCGGHLTVRPGVVDVQVKLTTLAGLDEHPAVIPGLGVTLAPIARCIAFDPHTRPTWRWSIFDRHGDLLHHGLTRARPTSLQSRSQNEKPGPFTGQRLPDPVPDLSLDQAGRAFGPELRSQNGKPEPSTGQPASGAVPDRGLDQVGQPVGAGLLSQNGTAELGRAVNPAGRPCTCVRVEPGRRRGVVELQLTLATLRELTINPSRVPGWQAVLADIAAQVEQDRRINPPGKWEQTDRYGNLRHHGHTARMPDATEEAFIRARDRSCRAPHCAVTASRCELDHRIEYAKGGPSHRGCIDLRCKRHHHLRDRHDVRITRTGPIVTWTIPSGRTFTVTTDKDLILTRDD